VIAESRRGLLYESTTSSNSSLARCSRPGTPSASRAGALGASTIWNGRRTFRRALTKPRAHRRAHGLAHVLAACRREPAVSAIVTTFDAHGSRGRAVRSALEPDGSAAPRCDRRRRRAAAATDGAPRRYRPNPRLRVPRASAARRPWRALSDGVATRAGPVLGRVSRRRDAWLPISSHSSARLSSVGSQPILVLPPSLRAPARDAICRAAARASEPALRVALLSPAACSSARASCRRSMLCVRRALVRACDGGRTARQRQSTAEHPRGGARLRSASRSRRPCAARGP